MSDYFGRKLIIFFYPKANTPGCTAEACDLRDHYKELKEAGYSNKQIDSIYGPIGIKLGGKSASEIALSIISQLVLITNNR